MTAPAAATEARDRRFMALALSLGRRGQGRTWPNPAVGCVIVREGRIVGRGWTMPGGRPHAETVALAQAGAAARGATAYVTLEPCSHHGRTPPCAEALVGAGVARVVVALSDPDPRVAGQGVEILRQAGIAVELGVLAGPAADDLAGYLTRVATGRPAVTLKMATSLDGRIATATGESRWITGPEARRRVHAMRSRHDAVMIGGGTARADDPRLTVRGLGVDWQPVRVILSRRLELPESGALAASVGVGPLWLLHGPDAPADRVKGWQARGAETVACALADGQLDPADALQKLGARGLTRVFCEGGAALAASLVAADLVDRLAIFAAGLLLGAEGTPALGALGLERLADARRYRLHGLEQVGDDVLQLWDRRAGTASA